MIDASIRRMLHQIEGTTFLHVHVEVVRIRHSVALHYPVVTRTLFVGMCCSFISFGLAASILKLCVAEPSFQTEPFDGVRGYEG